MNLFSRVLRKDAGKSRAEDQCQDLVGQPEQEQGQGRSEHAISSVMRPPPFSSAGDILSNKGLQVQVHERSGLFVLCDCPSQEENAVE